LALRADPHFYWSLESARQRLTYFGHLLAPGALVEIVRADIVEVSTSVGVLSFREDRHFVHLATDQWASMDYRNALDLTGSIAVISGGSRGIGFEAAVALGSCGATVVLLSRDRNALDMAVERLVTTRIDATCAVVDVTDPMAVTRVADAIVAQHGKVDTLVNSAGIARINSAVDTPDDEWRAVLDVNVNGLFWCCRAFGRHMIARRAGSIVNLGSMSGLIVNRPQTAASYMASKGAVHMLTKALAAEWAKCGVRVNALAPGYVATDMTLKMRERPELFDTWLDMTPMGRLAKPSEIASAVVYLASAASSFITGAILSIDGGYTAW
jgi:galactitol 2-dehydrogenase (L-tagatose-forming)